MNILDNKEKIVEKIVSEKGLTKDEIEERIREKVKEYGGLLTEAGAAFSIAKELGVKIDVQTSNNNWVRIKDLKEELGFASVSGVVKMISKVKDWTSGEKSGKVVSLIIDDGTGDIRVTLWNQDAELVNSGKIKLGDIIGIKNAIIKKGQNRLELSVGMRGRVILNPNVEFEIPSLKENIVKINELSADMDGVSVYGRVIRKFEKTTFKREDGSEGKMASIILGDGTANARLVLWGANADYVNEISIGDLIKVENANVKDNQGKIELHLGWKGRIIRNPKDHPDISELFNKEQIDKLKDGDTAVIRATVVKIYPPTQITICPVCGAIVDELCPEHNQGRKTYIVNAELDDGTGVIRGVMFRRIAEKFIGENLDNRLGEELMFYGKVKMNDLFDRKEFIVQDFEYPNPEEEIRGENGDKED